MAADRISEVRSSLTKAVERLCKMHQTHKVFA